jgi:hypothetical protein
MKAGHASWWAASSPSAPSVDEPENDQKHYGADRGGDDGGDDADAKVDAQLGQQPITDKGADDPNDDVVDETEAGALHDLSGKPSRNSANQQYD